MVITGEQNRVRPVCPDGGGFGMKAVDPVDRVPSQGIITGPGHFGPAIPLDKGRDDARDDEAASR